MNNQGNPDTPREKEVAIVFVDIVASASLMAHLGDLHTKSLFQQFSDRAGLSLKAHKGLIYKDIGDGFLAVFHQTVDAVEFAIEFQQSLSDNPIPADGRSLQVRIAVHSDKVLIINTEYGLETLGSGVNLAARLLSYCVPGSIILSAHAYQQLPPDSAARFPEHQQVNLKGVGEATAWSLSPTSEAAR